MTELLENPLSAQSEMMDGNNLEAQRLASVLVDAGVISGNESIKTVSAVGEGRHLVGLEDADVVITDMPPGTTDGTGRKIEALSTEWQTDPDERKNLNTAFYLRGLFEQKQRRVLNTEGEMFRVEVLTNASRFNSAMQALGREPGKDCFKLVEVSEGKFSARLHTESAAHLEVPIATQDAILVEHDRRLSDHIQMWWSTPYNVAAQLKGLAQEAISTNDEEKIKQFSAGLDLFEVVSEDIVVSISDLVDGPWEEGETVLERTGKVLDFISGFTENVGLRPRTVDHSVLRSEDITQALIKTGFMSGNIVTDGRNEKVEWPTDEFDHVLTNSPEVIQAKELITDLAIAYTENIVDILGRVDSLQGVPPETDPARRALFIEKLKICLQPELVGDYIDAKAKDYLDKPQDWRGPASWSLPYGKDRWKEALEYINTLEQDPTKASLLQDLRSNFAACIEYQAQKGGLRAIVGPERNSLQQAIKGEPFDEEVLDSLFGGAAKQIA